MEARREFLLGIIVLVGFQVLTSFGAIALLTRMSPAIERILAENVYTIEGAEEILAVVASEEISPDEPQNVERFEKALQRVKSNITEPGEARVIQIIERDGMQAISGNAAAVTSTVEALRELVAINHAAMRRAGAEAKRLGAAGAWAAVLLAVAGFSVSLIVARRLRQRILDPLAEIYEVLESGEQGNRYRRCYTADVPFQVRHLLESINALLDRGAAQETTIVGSVDDRERAVMLHLLEQQPDPVAVVDEHGEIVAANQKALTLLSGPGADEIRQTLRQAPSKDSPSPWKVTHVGNAALWLCVYQIPGDRLQP
jgi:PAS domain-containing protein